MEIVYSLMRHFLWLLVLVAATVATSGAESLPSQSKELALLPLANHSGNVAAAGEVTSLLGEELDRLAIARRSPSETRDVLRRHRIRAVGRISRTGAHELAADLDVPFLLTGTIDAYNSGANPEVALSLRLVHAQSLEVLWAQSAGASGEDHETVFGLGRVTDIAKLARRVVAGALKSLPGFLASDETAADSNRAYFALVAFDDLETSSEGGDILPSYLITEAKARGLDLLEPGAAYELFLQYERTPRGGIDYELLTALHDSLNVTAVITGVVNEFRSSRGTGSYPFISASCRLIDAETGLIRAMADVERSGNRESILGMGRTRSSGRLMNSAASSLLDRLRIVKEYSIAR